MTEEKLNKLGSGEEAIVGVMQRETHLFGGLNPPAAFSVYGQVRYYARYYKYETQKFLPIDRYVEIVHRKRGNVPLPALCITVW